MGMSVTLAVDCLGKVCPEASGRVGNLVGNRSLRSLETIEGDDKSVLPDDTHNRTQIPLPLFVVGRRLAKNNIRSRFAAKSERLGSSSFPGALSPRDHSEDSPFSDPGPRGLVRNRPGPRSSLARGSGSQCRF